jgi:hypothetical protein
MVGKRLLWAAYEIQRPIKKFKDNF